MANEKKNDIVLKNTKGNIEDIDGITVDELVQEFERRSSDSGKKLFLEARVKTIEYMDYEIVQGLCDNIIANSYLKDGEIFIDSCKSYYFYVFTILKFYTNIIVNDNDFAREFNLLNKAGLIDIIFGAMPEGLMGTFDAVLQMKKNDFMTNYYETHSYINRTINKLVPVISNLLNKAVKNISVFKNEFKNINWNEIDQLIQKYS